MYHLLGIPNAKIGIADRTAIESAVLTPSAGADRLDMRADVNRAKAPFHQKSDLAHKIVSQHSRNQQNENHFHNKISPIRQREPIEPLCQITIY